MDKIFTIGHSTYTIECFVDFLEFFQIDTIVDVRSVPYSRFVRHFNKEQIAAFLKKKNIVYIPMGGDLGARYEEKEVLFEDGKVDFLKVIATKRFQEGISRVEAGIKKGYKIALMCSEKNPIKCHRFSLISNYLHKSGYLVNHIVDKEVFEHGLLEEKLIKYYEKYHKISMDINRIIKFHYEQSNLFDNNIDKNAIYVKLNRLIGYNPAKVKKIKGGRK